MPYFESGGGTKWNLVDSKTGTTAIPLPSDFNELLAIVAFPQTTIDIPVIIPKNRLTNSARSYRGGYYGGSNTWVGVVMNVTLSAINLVGATNTSNDVTSTSTLTVYYR